MIWGIFSLILLLVTIGLVIWLLVRSNNCPSKKTLNQSCNNTTDCNSGLVCSTGAGTALTTPNVNSSTAKTCKVATGEVCLTASECAAGLTCRNGICVVPLGTNGQACPCEVGFTCISNVCRAIVGQPCAANSDCATGICQNNVCMVEPVGPTGSTGCSSYSSCDTSNCSNDSNSRDCSNDSRSRDSSNDSRSRDSGSRNHSRDSGSRNHSRDSSTYSKECRRHSYDTSDSSKKHSYDSYSNHSYDCSKPSSYSKNSYSTSSDCKYVKRGVYVTNEQNQDQTLFAQIEQPIIDIAKTDRFYLLLKDGNIVANTGNNNTMYTANKKMVRMVRFGNEIVGIDKNGKLFSANKTNGNTWNWEHLNNFPDNVEFINSTNTGINLEVLTCGKAFLYAYSTTWKEGKYVSSRKARDYRYYGKDIARYIDINNNYIGKTNDGQKVKGVKAAGFYPSNVLIPVLEEDSFTHNRVIDTKAYFLFEQN